MQSEESRAVSVGPPYRLPRQSWRGPGDTPLQELRWPPYARRAWSSGWPPSRPRRNFHPRLGTALHRGVVRLRARAVVPVRLGRRGYRRWLLNVDRRFLHDDRWSVVVRRRVVPPIPCPPSSRSPARWPPGQRCFADDDAVTLVVGVRWRPNSPSGARARTRARISSSFIPRASPVPTAPTSPVSSAATRRTGARRPRRAAPGRSRRPNIGSSPTGSPLP